MKLLQKQDYQNIIDLIKDSKSAIAFGVIDQIMQGEIYVDDPLAPNRGIVVSASGQYFLFGDETNDEFNESLVRFLFDKNNHKLYYDLYASTENWIDFLASELEGDSIPLGRFVYEFDKEEPPTFHHKIKEVYQLKRVDEDLFLQYTERFDRILLEAFRSVENFLENGTAYCVIHEEKIVSICYSFSVGGGLADIGVFTVKKHQGEGLALVVCSAFIEECLKKKLTPIWDCGNRNEPSIKLVEKLGFKKEKEHQLIFWHENRKILDGYLDGTNFM